ncbi:MAG TPA: Dabb family protein [Magnetospirillum sp.]|jgi:quinol monooxygenase YgiN|nr:Dabb family protein [Magnetospirillum sp.]
MIKHIVFWRLNGETPAARHSQATAIKQALEALNGRIPGLLHLEVGIDVSRDADAAHVVLYSEFEDQAALEAYHHHPEHQKVAPLVRAARSERRVVDYEA